jgi:hypothetical protein
MSTTLSKTDEKSFALIEPHLVNLQKFVDANIKGASTMTAATIHEKFTECDMDKEEFIKGFRVAVRIGKITGIEGAQRAGYRRIGDADKGVSASDSSLEGIAQYLEKLQVFVDKYIQGSSRMTAAVIYDKFKAESGCTLTEEEFIKAFRIALKEERITGLESAYRFGYKRAGMKSESDDPEDKDEKEKSSGCIIMIDDNHRMISLDRMNWGFQVRKDSGSWSTESYHSNYKHMVQALATKVIDYNIKDMKGFNFKALEKVILDVEVRVSDLLKKAMDLHNNPPSKKVEDVEEAEEDTSEDEEEEV